MKQVLNNINKRKKKGMMTALDKKILEKVQATLSSNPKGYGGMGKIQEMIYGNNAQ